MIRSLGSWKLGLMMAALAVAACSPSKTADKGGSDGGSGGSAGGESCTNGQTTAGACERTFRTSNDAFCHGGDGEGCSVEPNCGPSGSRPIDSCCVLVAAPGKGPNKTLARTTDTRKYASPSGGEPDLSCFEAGHYPVLSNDTSPVTMKGRLIAFASGCDLVGVKIEVFKVRRTGVPETDGELGELVGSPVITTDANEIELEDVEKCQDPRKDRLYEYPGVPKNTELVVKTSAASASDGWSPFYTYNLYITDDDPDLSGDVYTRELEAMANDDFGTIPSAAIGRTITAGNGAIGGEVHDCRNVRLQNAMVDVSVSRVGLVYFNESEDNPFPDVTRTQLGTGRTGLYAALDVKPGPVRVAATGLVPDGNGCNRLVSLGYYDIRVFPDGVTSVSMRGLRAFQAP
ncbi:MAG: hypothetical protein OZ921_14940 [Sorangiineae bacterium]|nr:hypothetical protein [Polyangiaceae bacterium]MEB2323806.1 hypothetical protein [Sorangiineae bacterium]